MSMTRKEMMPTWMLTGIITMRLNIQLINNSERFFVIKA
jgi:hypothetical protein